MEAMEERDKKRLLELARASIEAAFEDRETPPQPGSLDARSGGVFVSLHESGRLRGCIGRMEAAEPLPRTVAAMARAAAFEDPRFPPLSKKELPALDIEITLLSPRRRVASVEEIVVGRHGVHLAQGGRAAVFLPQVAPEQGWDRERLLEELCRKAGLPGGAWRRPDAELQVFEGLVFGEEA